VTTERLRTSRGGAAVLVCLWLGACSIGPAPTQPPADYDLGPPRSHAESSPRMPVTLLLPDALAPAWLNGTGIVYRLNYETGSRTQSYALSRWAAPPPALLSDRLRSRFAAAVSGVVTRPDGARADYLLRVELEDFSQTFDAPGSSSVALRARASLVRLPDRTQVAQRIFALERPAPTPDAPGAVRALGAVSDAFLENLLAWTQERVSAAVRRRVPPAACGRQILLNTSGTRGPSHAHHIRQDHCARDPG